MAITTPCYCTREDVKSSLDVKDAGRANLQVDRAIEAASRMVEGLTNRKFYPWTGTRYLDWPDFYQRTVPWRLWLNQDELISITSLVSGGITISPSGYFLEPSHSGPPYTSIEINRSSNSSFNSGVTPQRSVAVTGVFGFSADTTAVSTLGEVLDASEVGVDLAAAADVGVGNLIQVDSERMLVTGKSFIDTGQTAVTIASALASLNVVTVADTSTFAVDEVIRVGTEQMLVLDVPSSTQLTVKRAWNGTIISDHTSNLNVYANRQLTVVRGAVGTTAATHSNGTTVYKHVVPGLIRTLTIAEAINIVQQEQGAYARVSGTGGAQGVTTGGGLDELRESTYSTYGRKARTRVV